MRRFFAFCVMVGAAHGAPSDGPEQQANELLREARRLSDAGQVAEAIERFRAAEAIFPRGIHDCNLGLAYGKLKKPAHSLLYLESCRMRTTGGLPDWVDARIVATRQDLSRTHAPLDVSSEPPGARVTSSSLGADGRFTTPRRIWVPKGDEELVATLAGYEEERQRVTVRAEQSVKLQLRKLPAVAVEPSPAPVEVARPAPSTAATVVAEQPPPRDTRRARKIAGGALLGVGAGLLAVGLILNLVAVYDTRPAAEQLGEGPDFRSQLNTFHLQRDLSISGYVIGGVAALAGTATLISSRF